MKVIIHGRPQGQDKWSSDGKFSPEEELYVRAFLEKNSYIENKTDALIISIENRKFYYTYIRKKGISEVERSDSYFAITLILDKRCTDVNFLIELLEGAYLSDVVGKLIKDNKYEISQFKFCESVLSPISQCIIEQYTKHLHPISSDNEQIKDSDRTYVEYHFNDIDCPAFVEDYKHRIIVSAEYPTKNAHIKRLESQLSTIKEDCKKECQKQINSIKSQCAADIKAEKERCDEQNAELRRRVSQLEQDNGNLDKHRQKLEGRLTTIANAINGIGNTPFNKPAQPMQSKPLEKWLPWFNTLLLIIIVGLFIYFKPIESSQVDEPQHTTATEPQESEIPTIEIEGIGPFEKLEVGKEYELSYSDEKDGGKFVCDDKGTINDSILKPLKEGIIEITYEINGVGVASREYTVKAN